MMECRREGQEGGEEIRGKRNEVMINAKVNHERGNKRAGTMEKGREE